MASAVPTAQPCGSCDVCKSIALGSALDIIEIDAASNTGVDNIREIIERAQYAPVQCRYKVYIIDECLTGDSLILTSNGWLRIDDRTLVGQNVLSYNDCKSTWEWKRVLRWLDRGEKPTLTIKTTQREITCTSNHLIRTDRGWIEAQNLKPGMKILSPLSQSSNKQKNFDHFAPVGVGQNYLFPPTCSQAALSIESNLIGNNTSTLKVTASGSGERQNSLRIPQSSHPNNSDSFMEPCWGMALSPTPINTANYPDWLGHMESVNKTGYHTKPVDCQNLDQSYKLLPIKDMVSNHAPAKQPVIHSWSKSLMLSNPHEQEKQLPSNGYKKSPLKDWYGGISMMVLSPSVQKEVPQSIYTQKAILPKKTNLLLTGLPTVAIQPRLNPTKKAVNTFHTITLDLTPVPVVNGWKTYDPIPSHQWHTSLETIEYVNLAGTERVYDLEVEDNHNFVANGLLVHNCHMLTTAAFNSLLKTLEEPPPHVVFVLATTDPQRVLPTIISRCQRFDYRRIPLAAMVGHLTYIAQTEQIDIPPASITLISQIAQGGLRDAESLLDQLSLLSGDITPDRVWDLIGSVPEQDLLEILQSIATNDPESLLDRTRNILERGKEPLTVLQNLAGCYRDLLIAKTAPQRPDLVALTHETWTQLSQIAKSWQIGWILAGQQHLKDSEVQIKHTTQPRLWLEITLLGLLAVNTQQPPVNPATSSASIPSPQPISSLLAPVVQALPPQPEHQQPTQIVDAHSAPLHDRDSPATPANLPLAASVAPVADDLKTTWEQVLQQLLPASKDLFKGFGTLTAITAEQAVVAMKSSTMQQIATGKVPELAKVFSAMFGRSIAVKLEVMGKNQTQAAASSAAVAASVASTPTPPTSVAAPVPISPNPPAPPEPITPSVPAPNPPAPPLPIAAPTEYLTAEDEDSTS